MKQFFNGWALAVAMALALPGSGAARAAGEIEPCVNAPDAEPVADPYRGYVSTGYKGAPERDEAWFAAVRERKQRDGSLRYVFQRAPAAQRVEYESIETVSLGGRAHGFVAYRQGCGVLLDRQGRSLAVPAFEALEVDDWSDSRPRNGVLLQRKLSTPAGGVYSYLLFVDGRLSAASPHQYLSSYSAAAVEGANTQSRTLKPVAVAMRGGMGLLDMRSLREVLAPRWLGVGQITDFSSHRGARSPRPSYLLGRDEDGLHLHTLEGRPIVLPRFDRFSFVPGWMLERNEVPPPGGSPGVIQTEELVRGRHNTMIGGPCRLYNEALEPLFDTPLPAHACLDPHEQSGRYFAMSVDGKTQVYRKSVQNQRLVLTRVGSDIAGEFIYPLDNGLMVLEAPPAADAQALVLPRYRVVTPDGQDLPERGFDSFTNLGCGFLAVGREGKRWMLREDGSLSSQMAHPFSC